MRVMAVPVPRILVRITLQDSAFASGVYRLVGVVVTHHKHVECMFATGSVGFLRSLRLGDLRIPLP